MCPRRNGMVKGTVIAFALVALPKREQDVAFDLVRGHMTLVVVMHRHGLPWAFILVKLQRTIRSSTHGERLFY